MFLTLTAAAKREVRNSCWLRFDFACLGTEAMQISLPHSLQRAPTPRFELSPKEPLRPGGDAGPAVLVAGRPCAAGGTFAIALAGRALQGELQV